MANQLDLGDAQLLGFYYGKWHRRDIIRLIKSMGLTKSEWIKLKKDYPIETNMDKRDILEIDTHFKIKQDV